MATDNKRKLYDALSQEYDMGSYEQFCSDLNDENKRRKLYEATSEEYDMGSWDSFSQQLGYGAATASPSGSAQSERNGAADSGHGAVSGSQNKSGAGHGQTVTSFRMRRGGRDFSIPVEEVNAAGGLDAWAKAHPGAPVRVYMRGKNDDGSDFNGHVDLSQAHERNRTKGYKYQTVEVERFKPTERDKIGMSANLSRSMQQHSEAMQSIKDEQKDVKEYAAKGNGMNFGQAVKSTPQLNAETGEMEDTWLTPDGKRTTSKAAADLESFNYRMAMDMSIGGQLRRANERLAYIEKRLSERGKELMAEHDKNRPKGLAGFIKEAGQMVIADKVGGAPMQNPEEYAEFTQDKEYQSLRLAMRKAREEIQKLQNAKERETHGERFWHDFGRATGQAIANADAWDFGIGQFRDATTMMQLNKAVESGKELSKAENDALTELYLYDNVQNQYGDLGKGDRWGEIAGYSLSFMKDFLLTGGFSGVGTKIPTAVAKKVAFNAAKKMGTDLAGKKVAVEIAENGVLNYIRKGGKGAVGRLLASQGKAGLASSMATKAVGVAAEDLLVRAPLMTFGVQGQSTAAKIIETKLGPVSVDENTGELYFVNDKTWGEAAWQAGADQVIENYSEMWGAHIPAMSDVSKFFGARNLTAAVLRATRENAGTVLSKTNKFLTRAGVNGYVGEVGEEYYGQLWRTMLDLDSAKDSEGNNLLGSGQFHGDIWGGMALSIGMTSAGTVAGSYGVQGAQKGVSSAIYLHHKKNMQKSAKRASTVFGADWENLQQLIDSQENHTMGAFAETVLADPDMTQKQKDAAMDYMEKAMTFRGYNLGEMLRGKSGEVNPQEQELSQSYMDGYEGMSNQEMTDAYNMYQLQKQMLADTFADEGLSEEDISAFMEDIDSDPVGAIDRTREDLKPMMLDYANALMVYQGMVQRGNDDIDSQVSQLELEIDANTNRKSGWIQPATMKLDDRQVYVVDGHIALLEDGNIDTANSDNTIIIRDAETGRVEFASPRDLLSMGAMQYPAEMKMEQTDALRQELERQQADKMNGKLSFEPGSSVLVPSESGMLNATVVGPATEKDGTPIDGMILVQLEDGSQKMWLQGELQWWADEANRERVEAFEGERARIREEAGAELQTETATQRPAFALNDEFTILNQETGKPVYGTVTGELDEDGMIEIYTEEPLNGSLVNKIRPEELEGMLDSYNGEAMVMPSAPASAQIESAGYVDDGFIPIDQNIRPDENGNIIIPEGSDNGSVAVPEIDSSDVNTEDGRVAGAESSAAPQTALERIPRNEKGEPVFEQAETPELGWDALVEARGGDVSKAQVVADMMAEIKRKVYEKLQKQKPKGSTPSEIIASQDAIDAELAQAELEYKQWQDIANVERVRQAAIQAEQEAAERESAELAAAEEAKRKALEKADKRFGEVYDKVKGNALAVERLRQLEPETIYEAASVVLSRGKILWDNKGGSRGFKQETGYGEGERKKMFSMFATKENGGRSLRRLAEDEMQETCALAGIPYDNVDAFNALTEVISEAQLPSDIRNYIKNRRIEQALEIYDREQAAERAAYEEWCYQNFGMSVEEYEAYEEQRKEEIRNALGNFDENEYFSNIADELIERENERRGIEESVTQGENTGDVGGGEILSTQGPDTQGGRSADAERQGVSEGNGNQVVDTTGVVPEGASGGEGEQIASIGFGKFGQIFAAFRGKAKEAWRYLSALQSGQARGVFYRPEIGEIDLVWGDAPTPYSGKGLAHIDRKHVETLGDFSSMEEAIDTIDDVIANGEYIEQDSRTAIFDKGNYRVVVARDESGNWVLTAFDNKIPAKEKKKRKDAATPGTAGQPNAEARAVASNLSAGKDNNSAKDKQEVEAESLENVAKALPLNGTDLRGKEAPKQVQTEMQSEPQASTTVQQAVEAASAEVNTEPTPAQAEAGNYKKGHVTIGEFDITIENPAGSQRKGVDANGKEWHTTMANAYGYIKGTEGVDGDHIDVFLHSDMDQWNGRKVYVVDQTNTDGSFDEHKVMLGFNDKDEAMTAYLANYDKTWAATHPGLRISETNIEDFNKWVQSSHRKTKPFAEYSTINKVTDETPKPKKHRWVSAEDADEFDSLRDGLRDHFGKSTDMINESEAEYGKPKPKPMDAEVLRMGTRMTYLMLKGGLRKFSDYCEAIKEELPEIFDEMRPHLKSLYAAAQNMEEVIELGWDEEMDDRKTVKAFDVYNFDKTGPKDIISTAQHIVDEYASQQDTEKLLGTELAGDSAMFQRKEAETVQLVEEIGEAIESRVAQREEAPEGVKALTMGEIKKMASKYVTLEKISDTDLQELVELAMTQLTRTAAMTNMNGTAEQQKTAYERIVNMYRMQPSLNARDSERLMKQQYSTPTPFGFVMGQFVQAGDKQIGSVLEPSAGNGALTITMDPKTVHVNDIDEARLANLRKLGYGKVTAQDALLPFDGDMVDAVMTNPPFGSVTEKVYDGVFHISSLEGQMAINALEKMKDDGRAAIVIGGNTSYRTNGSMNPKDAAFLGYLYSHYNVADVINISGKALYSRNGTGYDVRIILIDGRKGGKFKRVYPPIRSKARAEQVTTFEELYKRVQDDIHEIQQVGNERGHGERESGGSSDGKPGAPVRSGSDRTDTGTGGQSGGTGNAVGGTRGTDNGQASPGSIGGFFAEVDNGDGGNAAGTDNVRGSKSEQSRSIGSGSASDGGGRSGDDGRVTAPSGSDGGTKRLDVKPDLTAEKVPYPNQSDNGFTLMSVVPAAQAQALHRSLGEIGDVDQYLVDELGYSSKDELYSYLAAEQIDSVALAIEQMSRGNAFIIGDMTGVGKGRQGAALIRYAVKQDRVPIYFTQKPTLFTDNYRDLADIGSGELRPFIIASNPKDANIVDSEGNVVHKLPSKKEQERVFDYIMSNGILPKEYDFVLTTYDQIKNGTKDYEQNEDGTWSTQDRKLPKKSKGYTTADYNGQRRRDALARLAEGNIAILDESHTVGGDSGCGRYMQKLTSESGGVTFLSATFAKRADNMPIYAQRTAISDAGVKPAELIEAIMKGGVTLQEIMSKQLVESGQMIRRERSFEGVTIDWLSVEEDTNRKQREQFNTVAKIFSMIRSFQDEHVTPVIDAMNEDAAEFGAMVGHTQGTKDMGVKNVPFASKMYNLVNQLLFALKVDAVADRVIENLKNGFKPVISFTNTMEGFLASAPKGVAMDEAPNFSLTLQRALDGVMRYTEKDADENTEGGYVKLSDLSEEGRNAYNAIREKIMNLSADLPISPMDAIRMKIEDAGYRIAEITGRTMQLNRTDDGMYIVEARKDRDKKAAMRDFNSGKLDVLMINKSGSTGISLHASSKFEDQRPRVMVFAQFQSDINDEVQMRGRIDRSGQVTRGRYEYIMSTIPAEQRIQMMFKAKLKSLDANTTSSQKSKFNEMEIVDYLNKYGDEVVWEYMKEHPELEERLGDPLGMLGASGKSNPRASTTAEDTSKKPDCAGKISRYLAFLSVEEQDEIFKEITEAYKLKIQLLNDAGENDLEITTMPLRAQTKSKKIWNAGTAPNSGNAFADNTYVEEVEADVLKKPMKRAEIAAASRKLAGDLYAEKNGSIDWTDYAEKKGAEINDYFEAKAAEALGKLQEAGEGRIAKAREKAVNAAIKARGRGENTYSDAEIESLGDTVAKEAREAEEAKQQQRREEIMNVKLRMLTLLNRLRAGVIYVVPQDLKLSTPGLFAQSFGTFVGFKFNKNYMLGSSTAIFATLDGRRKVELALNDPAIGTIITSTETAYRYSPDEINAINMGNWDEKVPTQTRQKRYIITGNLLQALVDTGKGEKTKGNLISYSTIDGETRQGILMSENFRVTDLRNSAPLSSRLAQIKNGFTTVSEDGDVQVEKVTIGWKHRGEYELRVPKSKQRGGLYTMHPELLKLVEGRNFVTKGNNMVAYVTEKNIAKVVDMLSRAPFNVTVLEESKLKEETSLKLDTVSEPGAGYGGRRKATVTGRTLFDWADDEEKARQAIKTEAPKEVDKSAAAALEEADTALDRYAEAYNEYLDLAASMESQLDEKDTDEGLRQDMLAQLEDEETKLYEQKEKLEENLRLYYELNNTHEDAKRIARDMVCRVEAEVATQHNRNGELEEILEKAHEVEGSSPSGSAQLNSTQEGQAEGQVKTGGGYISYAALGHLPNPLEGEFSHVERQFSRTGEFSFTGNEVVRDCGDVAYIFRALESYAVEHVFAAFVKDERVKVLHIGMGGPTSTSADLGAIRAGYDAFGADMIYLVHNHPSGNLTASGPDMALMRRLRAAFKGIPTEGLIIDTTSGRYRVFDGDGMIGDAASRPESGGEYAPEVVRFDHNERAVLDKAPVYISNPKAVEEFISKLRFGPEHKVSYLVLSNSNEIIGNFHTGFESLADEGFAQEIASVTTKYAGTRAIVYGNARLDETQVRQLKKRIKEHSLESVELLDVLGEIKGTHASANDNGMMEPGADYGISSPTGSARTESRDEDVLCRPVTDSETLRKLNGERTIKVYRAMQFIEGGLRPPMSAKVDGELRDATEVGVWEEAEEHPEMADENGRFKLDKGNGKSIKAAYNPYIHTSRSPINDQFSSAWSRPELVIVEVEVPESELTSGYKAEKAKDSVGELEWKSGPVGRKLAKKGESRRVILSRWDKVVRVVPEDEVAAEYAARLNRHGIWVPFNTVPPALRDALTRHGVKIGAPEKGNAGAASMRAYEQWKEMDRQAARIQELAEKLHLENVEVVTDTTTLEGKRATAKGFYNKRTGKITIVLPNNRSMIDAEQTLLHEAVAHYGLRRLFDDRFDTFLDNVYESADEEIRGEIVAMARENGWNIRTATEEYLASLAEDTEFEVVNGHAGWWARIKQLFIDMVEQLGFDHFRDRKGIVLTDNELRYLLWRSYENLARGKGSAFAQNGSATRDGTIDYVDEARDIAKQAELGVGNYAETGIEAEPGEDGELFRPGDFTPRDKVTARDAYERMLKSGRYQFTEAMQDSMLGLKELYKAVSEAKASGRNQPFRIEDIAGFENAYLYENAMSSRNNSHAHRYFLSYIQPLLKEIGKICGANKQKRRDLIDYMMAKHGLERNEYMRNEAINNGEDADRDFAGLTGLTKEKDWQTAEAVAQQWVDDYEAKTDTTALWKAINNATKATLWTVYQSGMISKETHDKIAGMYAYYIPLRGWDETTSDEVYGYLTNNDGPMNGSIMKSAEGRSSMADDPIATIAMMADDAIRQGNRNVMKQRFLNFVLNHPSDLVSVHDLWLEYDDVRDEWRPVFADISDTDTPEEVEQKVEAFEARMEALRTTQPDKYKRGREAQGIPYKVVKGNLREHQVLVKRGGQTMVLTINGNPRAAQALNGLTNPDVETGGVIGNLLKGAEWVNRQLSAFYTTRNPDFVVGNFFRDMLYSNCMMWVKESPRYARRFHKNFARVNPVTMRKLLGKWEQGTLDQNNMLERMFEQFMLNGGETGYTNVKDIEGHKRAVAAELRKLSGQNIARKGWTALGMQLDLLNRSAENCARFAAFVTSREFGRSIDQSIYDAKEVSVNFNKKGSGGKMINATGQTKLGRLGGYLGGIGRLAWVFWNAGLQGMTNFGRQAKRHPGKFIAGAATMFALGAIVPMLAQMLWGGDGDDDDKNAYYNLPEYVRRSNICLKAGTQWITIPLPIEFRSIYGLGELGYGVISGNERYDNKKLAYQTAAQVSQVLPLDMLEGGGGFTPLIPSTLKPFTEAYLLNKGWTGLPVYKDTPFNKEDPEWTKAYASADKHLVGASKWLNDATGGDDFKKGAIDINPAKVEYLLNGTFGGVFTFPMKLKKSAETAMGAREFEWRNMPIANRLVKSGDERTANRKLREEYFKYKNEYESTGRLIRKYENAEMNDLVGYAEKVSFLEQSPEYARWEVFDNFKEEIDATQEALKAETDAKVKKELEAEQYEEMRALVDALKNPKAYWESVK